MRVVQYSEEEKQVIEARKLTKCYGTQRAVSNISFTADKGRVLGFLGPNGAGKSTTMNMLTGYISATEGDVFVNGIDMFEEPEEAKKQIGYLPEIPPLYPDMTVDEYLKFVADLKGIGAGERKKMLDDIKNKVRIVEVEGRLIKHLSKGYRQRVGLASALVGYPEVLILDEPTVGLDPKQIIEIRELIRSLAADHTIILSSHILTEISEICDDIMVINHGHLLAVGTPAELMSRLGENDEIHIDVNTDEAVVEEILGSVCPEGSYRNVGKTEDGVLSYIISEQPETDIRADVFFAFAKAGIPLLKLVKPQKSLEEIFLEMIDVSDKQYLEALERIRNKKSKKTIVTEPEREEEKTE